MSRNTVATWSRCKCERRNGVEFINPNAACARTRADSTSSPGFSRMSTSTHCSTYSRWDLRTIRRESSGSRSSSPKMQPDHRRPVQREVHVELHQRGQLFGGVLMGGQPGPATVPRSPSLTGMSAAESIASLPAKWW